MTHRDDTEPAFFTVVKRGCDLQLSSDPHPSVERYLAIEQHGLLVMFPEEARDLESVDASRPPAGPADGLDHDAQLRDAFLALTGRLTSSAWSSSDQPRRFLAAGFHALAEQPSVREDVDEYLAANPSVASAIQMLFTSIAMSARADWRSAPPEYRGIAARGWFLGRWIPTFLVLDGPILRFLNSAAFRRQNDSAGFLRSVRAFFHAKDFMSLRHAFAHWSFSWNVTAGGSEIVAASREPGVEIRISRREADALHILTFAVVEAIHDAFIRGSATRTPPQSPGEHSTITP
jgi:hypothetical protein